MGNRKKVEKRASAESSEASPENSKEALLKAAKTLFSTVGYDGTTVKDLSERAGVNVSLVSYHFQGKEGLYRAVLEQLGTVRLSVAERILLPPSSVEEFRVRLQMFVSELFQWLVEEPELCLIVQKEIDSGLPIAKDIFSNTFLKIFEKLLSFLAAAKKEKIIRSDVDPITAASVINGSILHMARMDRLAKEFYGMSIQDESHRKKVIDQVVPMYINGLLRERV